MKSSAKPAFRITSRAASSTSRIVAPGRTAAMPAFWAASTIS